MTIRIKSIKRHHLFIFVFPILATAAVHLSGKDDNNTTQPETAYPVVSITAENPPLTTTIPARQWQTALNLLLTTLKMKINNFTAVDFQDTSSNNFRWYKKNGCSFQIGNRKELVKGIFSLLPARKEPLTIYLNDINKQKANVSADKGRLKIRVEFEGAGTEVRTNCVENIICGGTGNPNFNIEDMGLEIFLAPSITNGKLSYSKAESKLHGKLNHEGFNITVGILQEVAKMCNTSLDSSFHKMGEEFIDAYLNDATVKRDITEKLNMNLGRARVHGFSFPANMRSITINAAGDMVIAHD